MTVPSIGKRVRVGARRWLARPALQGAFRVLYRVALLGMNYGGAASSRSSGDELALARLARMRPTGPLVVFDVGANIGSYASDALDALGDRATVYAFEPSVASFGELAQLGAAHPSVRCFQLGLGAEPGSATLWASEPGSVQASTFVSPLAPGGVGEAIALDTLDAFCAAHGIAHVDLLKLDVEGGEHATLRGARGLLAAGAIDIIQFEFGQPSLGARTYFVDLFELLDASYQLYRVLPDAVVPITGYHESLEVFMSTNYLAVRRPLRAAFDAA